MIIMRLYVICAIIILKLYRNCKISQTADYLYNGGGKLKWQEFMELKSD